VTLEELKEIRGIRRDISAMTDGGRRRRRIER